MGSARYCSFGFQKGVAEMPHGRFDNTITRVGEPARSATCDRQKTRRGACWANVRPTQEEAVVGVFLVGAMATETGAFIIPCVSYCSRL